MGITYSPYHECQSVTWAKVMEIGDQKDLENTFEWLIVVSNLSGTPTYECSRPWVYKERSDRNIATELFLYVYDIRPIVPTYEVCWKALRRWGLM